MALTVGCRPNVSLYGAIALPALFAVLMEKETTLLQIGITWHGYKNRQIVKKIYIDLCLEILQCGQKCLIPM